MRRTLLALLVITLDTNEVTKLQSAHNFLRRRGLDGSGKLPAAADRPQHYNMPVVKL